MHAFIEISSHVYECVNDPENQGGKGMNRVLLFALCVVGSLGFTTLANAQATRTWVSGVGDDANPCSRTAPCKTFAGAISKTAAGGEISVLDPGGFGAVTITKSITIDGDGTLAGIVSAGTNGIIVNAGVNDKIVIRNVSINGVGTGLNGVRYLAGKQLTLDRVTMSGFTTDGVDVSLTASGNLVVTDCFITNADKGIRVATTAGVATASIRNTGIYLATTSGFEMAANNNSVATLTGSTIIGTGNNAVVDAGGVVNIDHSTIANNVRALNVSASGAVINVSDSDIYANGTGFAIAAGATIASTGDNRTANNGGATLPNASIAVH
jgi:hypothetical protein